MITLFTLIALVSAVQDTSVAVIPRPVHLTRGTGAFLITPATAVVTDRATRQIGHRLADWLEPATGYRLPVTAASGAATRTIALRLDTTLSRLRGEGYRLTVTRTRITLRAPPPAGGFYALETVPQPLPPHLSPA